MTGVGCIIENMSGRKLTYVTSALLFLQIGCFLLGAIVSPRPNSSMQYMASKCVDPNPTRDAKLDVTWFYPRGNGSCRRIYDFSEDSSVGLNADNIVFAFQMPMPREGKVLDYSRWQQNLIGILTADIEYEEGVEHEARVELMMKVRLGFRNKGDPEWDWKEYGASPMVRRYLDCDIDPDKRRPGYYYNCSIVPLFELGSLHHDFYLVNLRLPSLDNLGNPVNSNMGKLVDLHLVGIHQNGGFTKIWVSLKLIFLPLVVGELIWFWRRVRDLPRPPSLLEKTLLCLGGSLFFLNVPMELITLNLDMPWLPLLNDVKQGIFYANLMVFWMIFSGEHLMNDDEMNGKNGISGYWKKLAFIIFGCVSLLVFDVCERGGQIRNPFYSIWVTDVGARLALAFIVVAGLSAGLFFLFLCYMIYKVFLAIAAKQASLSSMSRVRRLHYQGIIWRFRFLMLATLVTAAMTTISFILGQVSEGQYKWDEDISLEYTSGFMTGVYGMWNIYILGLLFLYAPSHKKWGTFGAGASCNTLNAPHENVTSTGEEIEFAVTGAHSPNEPSEFSSLTDFIRHQATD